MQQQPSTSQAADPLARVLPIASQNTADPVVEQWLRAMLAAPSESL